MTIDEHLLQIEKKRFDFHKATELFENCKQRRNEWDTKAMIGILILNDEYMRGKKLASDTSNQSDFYCVNFVRDNIMLSINETLTPTIDANLVNKRNETLPLQDILELELNYAVDKEHLTQDMRQILISNKFMGFGVGKTYWSQDSADEEWWTGVPKHKPIDARKVWYVSKDNLATKKDIIAVFHRERYTIDQFKAEFPEYYKEYGERIATTSEDDLKKNYHYNNGTVDIVIYQYLMSDIITERAIANEEADSYSLKYFSEEEYEEFLAEKGANAENMELFKKTGEKDESTPVFDEKIRASVPIKRTESRWYQALFIPEFQLLLEEPEMVGVESDYVILPGNWNPDDIYPTPIAYDYKELLKISGILLTTMVLNTVKLQKPIPLIVEGALKNESHFLKNYHKIGVVAKIDSEWARKNPNGTAVKWFNPPVSGQMQVLLYQMVEKLLDKSMSTPDVMRGIPTHAQQSGKQTQLLQMQAKVSTKPDYFAIEEYLREVCERFKRMIAEKRNYPHKLFLTKNQHIEGLTTIQGNTAEAEVNTNVDNQLIDIVDKCFVRVAVESNIEQKNQIKDMQYDKLYQRMDIPFEEYILNQSWVKNPEKLIEAHGRSHGDRAVAEFINGNPELKQQVMALMQQNPELQGEDPNKEKKGE